MENGSMPITQEYLEEFCARFRLPKKLAKIGKNSEQEAKFELGNRLYKLRIETNRTQMDVACSIYVPRTTYAGYETGTNEPDLKTLIKLADLYRVTLDDLVGRGQL